MLSLVRRARAGLLRQHFWLIARLFVRGGAKRRAVKKPGVADGVQKKVFSYFRVPLVLLVVTAKVHNVSFFLLSKAWVYPSTFAVMPSSVVVKGAVPLRRVYDGAAPVTWRRPSFK